uniref:Uncharacterized protein n=1 Tax=uncultured Thiotrichaceae bacterium TaxID=298394 RepID=A0A6S6S1F0_9GAMM|nr:MAG: Unknown protein [uncultured Thiotrichaceae bacterium]
MNNTSVIDRALGYVPDPPQALIDNWQTAFIWLALGIIVFALLVLFSSIRRGLQGKHVNKGMLPFVKWPLLFASAGFNIFFTYYVFLPAGVEVAAFSAIVMGGVNLAEAYLVRLIIATWRHDLTVVFRLALLFTIPVFLYSLMAAGSSFSTMMNKNKDSQIASQLELQSAQDRIKQADAQVTEAKIGAENGNLLNALYRTDVRNSRGTRVSFTEVKESCFSGGYYARHYPELCNQYRNLADGTHTAASVASTQVEALATSADEKARMAQIIKDRPPEITPTLLGFGLGIAAVGFIVSLALESAIVGVGFFEELFIKPTPLPGLVKFANKALDWNANTITQRGLQVDVSPSPGTVNFSSSPALNTPFAGFGWNPKNPLLTTDTQPVKKMDATVPNVPVPDQDATVPKAVQAASVKADATVPKEQLTEMLERWKKAESAKVGDMIECATCGSQTEKRIDTKRFCSAICRKEYHRATKEEK